MAAAHSMIDWEPDGEYRGVAKTAAGALIQGSSPSDTHHRPGGTSVPDDAKHFTRSAPDLAALDHNIDVADVESLTKAVKVGEELANNALRVKSALAGGAPAASVFDGVQFVKPCVGSFTSGFGSRWGTVHHGIDLANKIGTPIYAVTDGVIIDSGPASGFGLWVRVLHPSGYISVYGHINRSVVRVGQHVAAGEKIAEMGNRGESTGPHLHFEIWDPNGKKINPVGWLATRGIRVTGSSSSD